MGVQTKPPGVLSADVLEWLSSLSGAVLSAPDEEEFWREVAGRLRGCGGADVVAVNVLEQFIQTRAVATEDGVETFSPGELWEPFTDDDERLWLDTDGDWCRDVAACRLLKPRLRARLLELGVGAAYVVTGKRSGELWGQLVFGWKRAPELCKEERRLLQRVGEYVVQQFALFNIRKGAELDPLTGLLNWYGLKRRWDALDARSGAVLFVDVESFRAVVQQRGRLAGEDLVRETARLLRREAGPAAFIARVSEDTFAALLPGACRDDAQRLARAVKAGVERLGDRWPPPRPYLTVGAAFWPEEGRDLRKLIEKAESRTYARKRTRLWLTMSTNYDAAQGRLPRGFLAGWLAASADGIVVTDADLKVLYVNPAFEEMTGYTLQEWLGKTPSFVSSGKTPLRVYQDMWNTLNTRGSWSGQVVNRHRSGREWMSYVTITRILDRTGRPVGYIGVARNVTDLPSDPAVQVPSWEVFEDVFTKETLAYALARAAQLHDVESGQHLERVREFTRLLVTAAAAQGMEEFQSYEFRAAVSLASILHDIGKIAVPQAVLHKPGKLTRQEFELVKTHTFMGRELLHSSFLRGSAARPPSLFLHVAMDITMYHHERWDGRGYPLGLAGRDIPVAARVVAIADVYDALRSARPYKRPWPHEAAVEYIRDQRGKHFDPELAQLFLEMSGEFEKAYESMPDT